MVVEGEREVKVMESLKVCNSRVLEVTINGGRDGGGGGEGRRWDEGEGFGRCEVWGY